MDVAAKQRRLAQRIAQARSRVRVMEDAYGYWSVEARGARHALDDLHYSAWEAQFEADQELHHHVRLRVATEKGPVVQRIPA